MSELLDEMRRLRHDLERSINKQNELQAKLDENLRLSRSPREFTFSGRGVSYPDLRIIDASGLVGTENISFTTITDDKRSRPVGSSITEITTEQIRMFHFSFLIKKKRIYLYLSSWKNVYYW
jgi:hypothetical protein